MQWSNPAIRRLSVGVVFVLVAGLVFLASTADGNVVPEPDLHDGGIWVTNEASRVIGRTNAEIATVDTRLDAAAARFDVLQSGKVVVIHALDPPGLVGVDPAQALLIPGPELPPDAQVALGGETAALFLPSSGDLFTARATSSSAVLALDPESDDAEPVYEAEGDGRMAVGVDGRVHLLDMGNDQIRSWSPDGTLGSQSAVVAGGDPVVTAVGPKPVVLRDDGHVIFPGSDPIPVDLGGSLQIQEPGPEARGVLVAGDDGLAEVAPNGSVTMLSDAGTGSPARPMRVGGCVYGAWGGNPTYVQACDGADLHSAPIPELDAGAALRFRTNHDRVTLNDLSDGSQLLFGDGEPVFIDNRWAEALTDEIEDDPDADEETDEEARASCESGENRPPVANPSKGVFGTRAGRPVVVYPLRNDVDPDCDVLLISSVSLPNPEAGTVAIIDGGRAAQVEVADGVDRLRFDYTVTDGRGGSDSSYVTVDVIPDNRNSPPVVGAEETFVVSGGTVTHNVLATAYDPDGDVLRLTEARLADTADGATHAVRFNPRGDVTFTAGDATGSVEVAYVAGDGRGGEATGILTVHVADRRENQAPIARNDAATSFAGREVVVNVLDNDTDPNGDTLSIVRAVSREDATVRWSPTSPEIRVSSNRAGTVNVVYRITDGQATDEAVLRVDFHEPGTKQPPIAVRDEVLLRAGEPAYVPVLDNDVAPDGDVLVVLGVSGLPQQSPIAVTVLRRSVLKISSATPLAAPVEFTYRISDGTNVADGTVVVEPAPTTTENRPPIAVADEFNVRAGGVVTLPVLQNDSDPDGDPIEIVAPDDDQPRSDRDGLLFLSHDGQLRYEAPERPRTVKLGYSIRDTAHNVSSAEITIHVLPPNPDRNRPPLAPELIGRTVAGQRVTIPVPVTTMDPDGDSVTLLGLDDVPALGTVVEVRPDEIVYEADSTAAGTDEFTYRVADQFGAEAVGTILVGVAGRPMENNPPIAVDDEAVVRPGATVSIPVLTNDFDPDGDQLTISTAPEHAPAPTQGTASVDGDVVRYTAPSDPTAEQATFTYTADDGRGGTQSATVTVTFRTGSDNRAPIAVDDTVEPQVPGTELVLPVLDNDDDPDGDPLEIVEVSYDAATITPNRDAISLVVPDEPVQFTYLISDGLDTARAAVIVPVVDADGNLPPIARLVDGIEVEIGASVTIDVLANDEDPEGESLYLFDILGVRNGSAERRGEEVRFTASEERYVGEAGFSYVVGDHADPALARTSVGSVKIMITGDVNTPPEFAELSVDVPQGGQRDINLHNGVFDPDDGDTHTFGDLSSDSDAFDASLDGGVLRVTTGAGAPAGSTGRVTFTVSDGTDETEGVVRVTVTGSDAPLAVAAPDIAQTTQGQAVTIDVVANDVNPFPDTPLRVVSAGTPTGGAGTTSVTGTSVTFAPDDSFFGETSFTYRIQDGTGVPEREVEGTVTVSVVGRPSPPPAPSCIGGESGRVRVQWVAPSANGAPITHYVVRVTGDGAGTGDRQVATATVADIDRLTNGAEYRFEVAAVNEAVGGAAPNFSAPSPPCVPDEVPGQPAAPTAEFGDGELAITWDLPENQGSALVGQTLTNTTTGESRDLGPTVTSYTWDGLENGTSYRFTVVAHNDAGPGPVSDLSTGDGIPAGTPDQPTEPSTSPGDRFITVDWTWQAARNNGDAPAEFRVTSYRDGVEDQTVIVGAASRSQRFDTDNGVEYEFTVEARNKAGWSGPSARSEITISAGRPLGKPGVTASEGDTQSVLTIDDSDVNDNGAAIQYWEYSRNGGAWTRLATNNTVPNLTNGTNYAFRVRAVNSVGAATEAHWSDPSNTVNPYGRPTTPNVNATASGQDITWTWPAVNGNGRTVDFYETSLDGGAWRNNGTTRSFSRTFGYDESHRLRVRAVTDGADPSRNTSAAGSAAARTGSPPAPETTIFPTGTVSCQDTGGDCTRYNLRGRNFPPNSTVSHRCQWKTGADGSWGQLQYPHTISVNANGEFEGNGSCHVGRNTWLRYQVTVNGQTYYTCERTRDQSSCTR